MFFINFFVNFLELIASRLPPVPEENQHSNMQTVSWGYIENTLSSQNESLQVSYFIFYVKKVSVFSMEKYYPKS